MYGDAGISLVSKINSDNVALANIKCQVKHAKRAQTLDYLPAYQTESVRQCVREVRGLDTSVNNTLASYGGSFDPTSDPGAAAGLLVEYVCMRRNKRCLLAYHRQRAEKVQEKVWKGEDLLDEGAAGTGSEMGEGMGNEGMGGERGGKSSLSPEEEEYARGYAELLAAYKGQWTDIDLTGSLVPPRDLFIDVRVLKDAGEIQTEYG
jgi:GINS complex subunit 1